MFLPTEAAQGPWEGGAGSTFSLYLGEATNLNLYTTPVFIGNSSSFSKSPLCKQQLSESISLSEDRLLKGEFQTYLKYCCVRGSVKGTPHLDVYVLEYLLGLRYRREKGGD